jgi:hypothetical protein
MLSRSDLQTIDEVCIDGELCAMILPACYDKPGIQFFTRGELSQQLALDVLFCRYDYSFAHAQSCTAGGNMVEVKQGPYAGESDKTRFPAVLPEKLKFD